MTNDENNLQGVEAAPAAPQNQPQQDALESLAKTQVGSAAMTVPDTQGDALAAACKKGVARNEKRT